MAFTGHHRPLYVCGLLSPKQNESNREFSVHVCSSVNTASTLADKKKLTSYHWMGYLIGLRCRFSSHNFRSSHRYAWLISDLALSAYLFSPINFLWISVSCCASYSSSYPNGNDWLRLASNDAYQSAAELDLLGCMEFPAIPVSPVLQPVWYWVGLTLTVSWYLSAGWRWLKRPLFQTSQRFQSHIRR